MKCLLLHIYKTRYIVLQNFLLCEEKNVQTVNCIKFQKVAHNARKSISIIDNGKPNNNENQNDSVEISNLAVVMRNVTSKWIDTQAENTLENIDLTVKSGNLIAVIGNVGAGKVYNIISYIIL